VLSYINSTLIILPNGNYIFPKSLLPLPQVPQLVDQYLSGELPIDHFITHELQGIESINTAMDMMHDSQCLRAVVKY